jgi:hypothetical protein
MFVKQNTFDAMKQRAESAEATVAAVNNLFGEAATAEGFDVVSAVKSLGTVEETETKPNARLAALATKHNVEVAGEGDDAVIDALEARIETYAGVTLPATSPKSKEEKIETDPKAEYPMTPFEASVREAAEKEAAFDKPVLD